MNVNPDEDKVKTCISCEDVLVEPYILCADCTSPQVHLCLVCLSRGWQQGHHQNNHRYEIKRLNFSLFDAGWTAEEELLLLDKIKTHGYGNWQDVAEEMGRTAKECEEHYKNCYLKNNHSWLPQQRECYQDLPVPKHIAYEVSDDPPRPSLDSQLSIDLAGYMPGRSDFAVEYDNYAELDLRDVKFDSSNDELETDIMLAVTEIYNKRLRERRRRKKIIKKYGLLNTKKINLMWQNCSRYLNNALVDRLRTQMKLVPMQEFDKMIECFLYEEELKEKIVRLKELREAGIKTFQAADVYKKLKMRRDEYSRTGKCLNQVFTMLEEEKSINMWKLCVPITEKVRVPPVKRVVRRLDVNSLPNSDKLSEREKELCAQCRLVPDAYLEFKSILINEYNRSGSLRLSQARVLVKIDVNKTRRIYDLLLAEKWIQRID